MMHDLKTRLGIPTPSRETLDQVDASSVISTDSPPCHEGVTSVSWADDSQSESSIQVTWSASTNHASERQSVITSRVTNNHTHRPPSHIAWAGGDKLTLNCVGREEEAWAEGSTGVGIMTIMTIMMYSVIHRSHRGKDFTFVKITLSF